MDKSNLNKAFKALRKAGYFAKQNFSCCQSCAWAEVPDTQSKKAVFYHRQDADDLKESGYCYLAWAGNGKEIVKILKENGVDVNWDGDKSTRMQISI